ncbi:FAD-dependent thymidylate synthase, partial [Patescibacteria group bacterium]|nr:FAD-dependent thymidylate synthase [Patescibacteria group bacterium]
VIQDNRLASYTAKSSRYQVYNKEHYVKPDRVIKSEFGNLYLETMDYLFDEYLQMYKLAKEYVVKEYPNTDAQPEAMYEAKSKARACDIVRYALPAGSMMNMAMTANARVYEHTIMKLLSHPSEEVQTIGHKLKTEIQKVIPTLVKYADKNEYLSTTEQDLYQYTTSQIKFDHFDDQEPIKLVKYDIDAYNRVVSSIIYRFSSYSYDQIETQVKTMTDQEKDEILHQYLCKMGKHDYPMRELEHIYYTFDILVDYGAFRDIQRHRICTQTNQALTTNYGYSIPEKLDQVGLVPRFKLCMEKAAMAFAKISTLFPFEAQYVIPMAFRKRVLITWNLRELFHFIRLRSGREGHISYRRVAMECYDKINEIHPMLGKYLIVDKSEGPSR